MKTDWTDIEPFRFSVGDYQSSTGDTFGAFRFRFGAKLLCVIAVDGQETGWEHVSVSVSIGKRGRTPTWDEMHWIKRQFWEDEEAVVQIHPPASEYVNNHANCLHLWRCTGQDFPLPPSIFVGIKELGCVSGETSK